MEFTVDIGYEEALKACLGYTETRRDAIASVMENGVPVDLFGNGNADFSYTELQRFRKAGLRNVHAYYCHAAECLKELLATEPNRKISADGLEN